MNATWPNTLLLLFKDQLEHSGAERFRMSSRSHSIDEHQEVVAAVLPSRDATDDTGLLLPQLAVNNSLLPSQVPDGCCVWGWWRKPWEHHTALFAELKAACKAGQTPDVFLYNQYERHLYAAALLDLYSLPGISSVVLPAAWLPRCPKRYRSSTRLCGAYFALRLGERVPDPADVLGSHVIAPGSFPFLADPGFYSTIHIPSDLIDTCRHAVYRSPQRPLLRSTDHTVFVMHKHDRLDSIRSLLRNAPSHPTLDAQLASALYDATWPDIAALLRTEPPHSWAHLAQCSNALDAIAHAALRDGAHITRFDLYLFSTALANAVLDDLLIQPSGVFSPLGDALRAWLTTHDARSAQTAARTVFERAWSAARTRYGLHTIDDYLSTLDSVESIIGTTKYEIAKKFYRDHLSHNVRAALLGAYLSHDRQLPAADANPGIIAFFAGLYHDLSMPLVTFASTVTSLASAVRSAPFAEQTIRGLPALNTEALGPPLNYCVLIAAIPDLLLRAREGLAWRDASSFYKYADPRLLHELTLCARRAEHAVVSAAMLFQQAVAGRGGTSAAVTSLLAEMLDGDAGSRNMREFLLVLQSAALHDRRPATSHWTAGSHHSFGATKLDWPRFALPMIVAIADECQEWGRPVGSMEGMGATDASVVFDGQQVVATFHLTSDPHTFRNVPYSVLEALFGKVRSIGEHVYGTTPGTLHRLRVSVALTGLDQFRAIDRGRGPLIVMRRASVYEPTSGMTTTDDVTRTFGEYAILVSLRLHDAVSDTGRDYLVLTVSPEQLYVLRDQLESAPLTELRISGEQLLMTLANGTIVEGRIEEYLFGRPDHSECSPTAEFTDAAVAIAIVALTDVRLPMTAAGGSKVRAARRMVAPHLLDYDWRFTDDTCRSLVEAARLNAGGGLVCYLGCPTLALWDSAMQSNEWRLFDRGHRALDRWIAEDLIEAARWCPYDVFFELPRADQGIFAIVVLDPPWYDAEYHMFLRRARQLVRPGGIIAVTAYPPGRPYDAQKSGRFAAMTSAELYGCRLLGSLEVSYEAPEFELSWGGHKRFIDAGFEMYRPSYVDFYQLAEASAGPIGGSHADSADAYRPLPRVLELEDGNYLRVVEDLPFCPLYGSDGLRITIERRKSVERMKRSNLEKVIAWSTRNAVVKADTTAGACCVRDDSELVAAVRNWESAKSLDVREELTLVDK